MTADLTGRALGAAVGAIGRVRPAAKPLHPRGSVASGTLTRVGTSEPTGVEWVDEPGIDEVLVRLSRGGGLPSALPDALGLAVRIHYDEDRFADLLFSSTGAGRWTRYLIRPARHLSSGKLGTIMPYRTPRGARLFAADARVDAGRLEATLFVASPRGAWQPFATIVTAELQPDTGRDTTFDPLLNTVAGLRPYEWVVRIRERAYAAARTQRGARTPRSGGSSGTR